MSPTTFIVIDIVVLGLVLGVAYLWISRRSKDILAGSEREAARRVEEAERESEAKIREAELAAAAGLVPNRMPVSVTPESIDLYMSFVGERPGLRQALENLDNSLVESLAKIVPGYINARWEGRPGINIGDQLDVSLGYIFDNIAAGSFKFENHSAQLQEVANRILADARADKAG